jgi:magnesium-transporting ATPase (P-type)
MGKINLQRVILGGLVAGVVLNIVDFVLFGVVLKDDYNAALQALNKPAMTNNMVMWFVALDFLYGIFLVWLYAAIRPRFGAGPGTAVKAGLAMWVLYGLLHALSEAPTGLFPQNLYVIGTCVALVVYPLAAVVGAKFYTEM